LNLTYRSELYLLKHCEVTGLWAIVVIQLCCVKAYEEPPRSQRLSLLFPVTTTSLQIGGLPGVRVPGVKENCVSVLEGPLLRLQVSMALVGGEE